MRDAQYETNAVLDEYYYHDNIAPFLCTRVMQRFGHSNPSPRYVSECVRSFKSGSYQSGGENFGSGNYGSLEAMVAAIILDPEATDPTLMADPSSGSVREPILKVLSVLRSMEYKSEIDTANDPLMAKDFQVRLWDIHTKIGQGPFSAKSIFSFFLPAYVADSGPTKEASMTSPEATIITMPFTSQFLSGMWSLTKYGLSDCEDGFATDIGFGTCEDTTRIYDRNIGKLSYEPVGDTFEVEADDLALLLTSGRLSKENRDLIVDACATQPSKTERTSCMQQLILSTGEFHTTNIATKSGEARESDVEVGNSQEEPYKAIVFFFLNGGVDSFNMLTPYECAPIDVYGRYRAIRGGVGLPKDRLLEIPANNPSQPCQTFGVHERLPFLEKMHNEGDLLWIANAGLLARPVTRYNYRDETPLPIFSHNDMVIATGKDDLEEKYVGTGVGGRIASVLTKAGITTQTFSIDGRQPVLSSGDGGPTPSIVSSKGMPSFNENPIIENMTDVIKTLNGATTADSGMFYELYASHVVDALNSQESLKDAFGGTLTSFPDSDVGGQLETVAQLMQSASGRGSNRDIFYVEDSGYDTHKKLDDRLKADFPIINAALEAFVEELKATGLWESTVILQFSEFGRTMAPNTGEGTDHGWAGNHFMLGGSVDGGKVLGDYPTVFEKHSGNDYVLNNGRLIPRFPWDAMWQGAAEWFGVPDEDLDKVLPMRKNFPDELLYTMDDLFVTP